MENISETKVVRYWKKKKNKTLQMHKMVNDLW